VATYYVNKSGSNANNGTTPTLAKLTIAAGLALTANGDTLIVGSGSYNERITNTNNGFNLYSDGVVLLDGTGLAGTGCAITGMAAYQTINIAAYTTGGKFVFKNYNVSSSTLGTINLSGTGSTTNISNCEIYGNVNNTVGISCSSVAATVQNCVFSGCSGYGYYNSGNYQQTFVSNTFYNCGYGIFCSGGTTATAFYNIFHTCTTSVRIQSGVTTNLNFNIYYTTTNLLTVNATNYTTLAAVQAIGSELQGYSANPSLVDPANGVWYLSSIGTYGAYPYSSMTKGASANSDGKWIITGSADNSGWYNADGHITKNGTDGAFELTSGSSGVIVSPVYDLGSALSNTKISLASQQTWPTAMLDYTTSDIRPNHQTVRIRASASTFNQGDVSPSWVEVNIESPLTGVNGRYLQVEITFQSADVAG